MGARAAGLALTTACLSDEWSAFNNIAGLSALKNPVAAVAYHAYPSFTSFNRMAAAVSVPLRYGVVGAGVFRFGDDLYNEQLLSAAFSNRFGMASLGAKINYIQYQAQGFGTRGMVTISFGGIAYLSDKVMAGAHITNINQPKISEHAGRETVPTILTAGLAVKAVDNLLIATEIEKDLAYDLLWKTGIEYLPLSKLALRTGFHINPAAGFFGIGFKPKKITLDYAYCYQLTIGASHQASVSYKFLKP